MDTVSSANSPKNLQIIGNNAFISVAGIKKIPAKIDTGADSSAIWASDFTITKEGNLEFALFAPGSPFYTGQRLVAEDFSVQQVRSSNGAVSVRYRVPLSITLAGRRIRATFTLADRSHNRFPVLIGRKTIQNKFLVDVSKISLRRPPTLDNSKLEAELRQNPHQFHQKYLKG